MQASDITAAITTVTGTFSTITGWFPVQIAAGVFVTVVAIGLIARFFSKKGKKKK